MNVHTAVKHRQPHLSERVKALGPWSLKCSPMVRCTGFFCGGRPPYRYRSKRRSAFQSDKSCLFVLKRTLGFPLMSHSQIGNLGVFSMLPTWEGRGQCRWIYRFGRISADADTSSCSKSSLEASSHTCRCTGFVLNEFTRTNAVV